MPENKDILLEKGIIPPPPPTGNNHLLVVAIDDYEHCPKLNNCVKDAKELIEILDSRYGISINAELPPLFNGDATKGSITQSFRKLAEKVKPQDNVLIYFSGHGEYDKVLNQGYWIPVEAKKGRIDTYLPNSEVRVFLEAINSHHTFIVVDSCFSGALFGGENVNRNIERLEQDPSRWGLTSGRNEIVSDGKVGENSPFAESLLYRLKQNTGSLGVMQLCTLVLEQVAASTMQTPRGEPLLVGGHKGGQFVFKPKRIPTVDIRTFTKVEDVDRFIATKPDEPKLEEAWWKRATLMDNLEGYEKYLTLYRRGKFAIEAVKALDNKKKEEEDWKILVNNTKAAISDYLKCYPEGRFMRQAEKIQEILIKPDTSIGPDITFGVKLGPTYYNKGFFNIQDIYSDYFGGHNELIDLQLGDDPKNIIRGKINRTANTNGSPRILVGRALTDWIQKNFKPGDPLQVDILTSTSIRLNTK